MNLDKTAAPSVLPPVLPSSSAALWPHSMSTGVLGSRDEIANAVEDGMRPPPAFQQGGSTTVAGVSDMRDFCKKQWPDLLAIACVGVAWLLTTLLGM